jgi:hypothetical protein
VTGIVYRLPTIGYGKAVLHIAGKFLAANGIDKSQVPAGSAYVIDGDTITVAQFIVDADGVRELCECECGCVEPVDFITHGYRRQAVTYTLLAAPEMFGMTPDRSGPTE